MGQSGEVRGCQTGVILLPVEQSINCVPRMAALTGIASWRQSTDVRFRANRTSERTLPKAAFDPNRTLAGSKSRTATALTELRQSDMVPARLV
jgi:hypothetical protein